MTTVLVPSCGYQFMALSLHLVIYRSHTWFSLFPHFLCKALWLLGRLQKCLWDWAGSCDSSWRPSWQMYLRPKWRSESPHSIPLTFVSSSLFTRWFCLQMPGLQHLSPLSGCDQTLPVNFGEMSTLWIRITMVFMRMHWDAGVYDFNMIWLHQPHLIKNKNGL